jgi:serine protease Do
VSDQLRSTGKVTRGRIGVQIDQVTKEVAESIGLGKAQGALVRGVESGAPAEKAGIEPVTSSSSSTARPSRNPATCRAWSAM